MLKSQDIVIVLKIFSTLAKAGFEELLSQNQLATHLCISASEVNAGIKRLVLAGLLGPTSKIVGGKSKVVYLPIRAACEECLIFGVKYFFPAEFGAYTRGIATSYAAPIFNKLILIGDDPIPVWPSIEGMARGVALEPLYSSVTKSLSAYPDQLFYELLVLVDTIRSGRARERALAVIFLKEKLKHEQSTLESQLESGYVKIRSKKIRKSKR
jgi:hypothetical protein